jgi:hypothetical protein
MSSLTRPASCLRAVALRPALSARPQVRFATQDYGSGAGNPAGETPEKQGKNESENLEHPGPAPPKVARGQSSSSPNNDDATSQKNPQKSGSSSGQQSQSNDGTSKAGSNQSTKGAQPKIFNPKPPAKGDESADVKKHNEGMDKRAEQSHEQVSKEDAKKDEVPKKFWSGESCWVKG